MDAVVYWTRWFLAMPVRATDGLPPTLALVLLSLLTGVIAAVLSRYLTHEARSARARAQMAAAIYEIRLYLSSPRAIVRAFVRLLAWSAFYLAVSAPLLLLMAPLGGVWFVEMESRFGLVPLPAGAPVLVRLTLAESAGGRALQVGGEPPLHSSPVLFVDDERHAYFNLWIDREGEYDLSLRLGDAAPVEKQLVADHFSRSMTPSRTAGWSVLFSPGNERPLPRGGITRIDVAHAESTRRWLGLALPWWLLWLALSTPVALVFRRRAA